MWSPAPRVSAAVVFALLVGTLSACAEPVSGPVLVLTLASPDSEVQDTAVPIKHFAQEVERLSQGTIVVEPQFGVPPPGSPGWDQYTARAVADDQYDLGLVPSRAFDALGVDTLRALNTPFLIQSEAAVEAVLDDEVRDDLLAGLPAAGVVGLDLFPAGLRHPFGYDEPLLGAGDYQGGTIRIALSETVTQMFAALGATVTDADASSQQRGAEAAYAWAPGPIATGNVTYFPKVTTLGGGFRRAPNVCDRISGTSSATPRQPPGCGCTARRPRTSRKPLRTAPTAAGSWLRPLTRSRACARPRHRWWRRWRRTRCPDRSSSGSAS